MCLALCCPSTNCNRSFKYVHNVHTPQLHNQPTQVLLNELAAYNAPAGTNPKYACDTVMPPLVITRHSLKTVLATAQRLQDMCEQLHASLVRFTRVCQPQHTQSRRRPSSSTPQAPHRHTNTAMNDDPMTDTAAPAAPLTRYAGALPPTVAHRYAAPHVGIGVCMIVPTRRWLPLDDPLFSAGNTLRTQRAAEVRRHRQ